jgi:hypothetical protein
MKRITSRSLRFFVSFQVLGFLLTTSRAGPFDEFISEIQTYVEETKAAFLPETNLFDKRTKAKIHRELDRLSAAATLFQGRQAVGELSGIFLRFGILDKRPCAHKILQEILGLYTQILEEPHVALQRKARVYFGGLYNIDPESKLIQFDSKEEGDQLGDLMRIQVDNHPLIYHIKTHRNGLKDDPNFEAKALEPYELFVYSFLEISGLGPKVHLFGDSAKDFYIATKDIGCPTDDSESLPVFTYKQLQDDHSKLLYVTRKKQPYVCPVIAEGLVRTDIISRIFGLSDLVTNPGNICFVGNRKGTQLVKFQVIDFSLIDQYLTARYDPHCLFPSFEQGNGNYHGIDDIAYYFLSTRAKEKRISYARDLFTIAEFIRWIDEAEEKVTPLLEGLNQAESEREGGAPVDMERFHRLVQKARKNAEVFLHALGAKED